MQKTITANGKIFDWNEGISLIDVLKDMGYKLKIPAVLIRVDGELIKKDRWNGYRVPEGADIQVMNVLRGG